MLLARAEARRQSAARLKALLEKSEIETYGKAVKFSLLEFLLYGIFALFQPCDYLSLAEY